jgi:hypothetical protein
MKRKLTAKLVEKPSLSLPSKDHAIYWDQSLGRLGLMITGKGHKSWSVQYRAGGRSRRIMLDGISTSSKPAIRLTAFEPSRLEGDDPAAAKKKARDSKDRHVRRHRGELPACRSKEPSIGRFVTPNARASCLNFAISRSARSGAETSPVCLDAIVGENGEVIADWPRGFWGSRRRAKRSLSLGYERAPINAGEGLCLASRIIKVMEFGRLRGDTMAAEGRAERGQTESG